MFPTKLSKSSIFILLLVITVIFTGCGGTAPPINHSPTIVSLTANLQSPIEVNQSTVITCLATDQDGDTLTYAWTKTGGTITGSGSTITWTAPTTAGTYTITCTVSDGELIDIQVISIVVTELEPENQPPVITSTAITSATVGEAYIYDVEATDPDEGDILVYALIAPAGMAIVDTTGVISWTPAAAGTFSVIVNVSDGDLSDSQSFTVTVLEPEEEIIIPDTTKITDEETESQLTSISQDQSEITFAQSTPQLEELQEGDILFIGVTDQTPYGLLRKVTSITRGSRADSEIVVETEFTSIEEAVEEIHISVNIVLTQDDIDYEKLRLPPGVSMSQDRGGFGYEHTFNLSDVSPIYEGDPTTTIDDVTIDGEIYLNYEMIFNLDIGLFYLGVEFRNIVESYTDLNVTVGGSLSLSNLLDPNPIHLFTIPFIPIPVAPLLVITPVIYINIGLNGEINAELTVGVTIDQTGSNRLESGFEYDNGTWHSIKNSPVFDLEPKIPKLNLGGTIKPYVGPQLELIFNGCAGVYGSLYGYLELQADINDDPWWCLYGGFEGIIGAQLKILSFDLGDPVEWTIFNPDRKLLCCADGPFNHINHSPEISNLTANPSSVDINQTTTITCTASDPDGDSLTYSWTKTGGTFEGSTSGSSVTWRAPSTQGNYTITCEISDGEESDSESVNISVGEPDIDGDITNVSPLTDPFTLGTWYTTNVYVENTGNTSHTFKVIASEPSGTDFEITQKSLTLNAGASSSTSFKYQFYGTETCRTLTFKLYDSSNNLLDPYTTGSLCPERNYDISIFVANPTYGTTSPPPGTYSVEEGSTYVIIALPGSGHTFDYWSGDNDGSSTSTMAYVFMDGDKVITAHFK
jgi:hypothetical protein